MTDYKNGDGRNDTDKETTWPQGETELRATDGWAQHPETAKQLAGGAG